MTSYRITDVGRQKNTPTNAVIRYGTTSRGVLA